METLPFETQQLLNTFLDMVRIDSPSGDEAAFRTYLIQRVQQHGLSYRVDRGGNLIVEVPAEGCDHDRILVLSGHMDVVPPCLGIQPRVEPLENDFIISSDNTTVLGADDKAGLAPILESVFESFEQKLPRPQLRLIFTTREETFLEGAKELEDDSLKAHFAITLDHTGRQGVIINQAPSYVSFHIECLGKSVHAGIMPEQGINAIVAAGKVIEQLHLGRIDEDSTCNIGELKGGKATNIVPDLAIIHGELRSHKPETIQKELNHIQQVLKAVESTMPGTQFTFKHQLAFEAYQIDENHAGVQRVIQAAQKTGLKPELIKTAGGSDNNVFVKRGLPGIVLSAGYIEPHSLKERVRLSEMVICKQFLLNILETFAHEPF